MKFSIVFATVTAAGPLRNAFINPAISSITERDNTKLLTGLPELPQSNVVRRSLQARAPPNPPAGTEFYMTNPDQWDQTPGRGLDSERVRVAWPMAIDLVKASIKRLNDLNTDADAAKNTDDIKLGRNKKPRTPADAKKRLRSFVARSDPAYTQMFGADVDHIGQVRDNFQKVLDGVLKQDAPGRDNRPVYLTTLKKAYLVNEKGDFCAGTTQAFVAQVKSMTYFADLKKVTSAPTGPIPHDDAWVINFCEGFFKTKDLTEQLDVLKQDAGKRDEICDLENLDNTARVLVHEWTHFGFTLDTNKSGSKELVEDLVGYDQVASYSTKGNKGSQQQPAFDDYSSKNADSYAWYATYNYMNELAECKDVHWSKAKTYEAAQCTTDVWPKNKDKHVKNSW